MVLDKLAFTALLAFDLLKQTCVTLVQSVVKPSPETHAAFKMQLPSIPALLVALFIIQSRKINH